MNTGPLPIRSPPGAATSPIGDDAPEQRRGNGARSGVWQSGAFRATLRRAASLLRRFPWVATTLGVAAVAGALLLTAWAVVAN